MRGPGHRILVELVFVTKNDSWGTIPIQNWWVATLSRLTEAINPIMPIVSMGSEVIKDYFGRLPQWTIWSCYCQGDWAGILGMAICGKMLSRSLPSPQGIPTVGDGAVLDFLVSIASVRPKHSGQRSARGS